MMAPVGRVILQGGAPQWAEALVTSLNNIIQRQEVRIRELEARLKTLEGS